VIDPLALFLVLLKASGLSLGGLGSLPLLRQDLVVPHIATEAQIVEALAIGRLSTGPNGLYVVSLGYQLAGVIGAVVATVAALLPPLVMLPATALARRWLLSAAFAGLVRGAALATAGLLCAIGVSLIVPAHGPLVWWQPAVGLIAAIVSYDGRLHPGLLVIGGAAIGILVAR